MNLRIADIPLHVKIIICSFECSLDVLCIIIPIALKYLFGFANPAVTEEILDGYHLGLHIQQLGGHGLDQLVTADSELGLSSLVLDRVRNRKEDPRSVLVIQFIPATVTIPVFPRSLDRIVQAFTVERTKDVPVPFSPKRITFSSHSGSPLFSSFSLKRW